MLPYQADLGGWNPLIFQVMRERAHGARAEGSDRHEERGINAVAFQKDCDVADRWLHGGRVGGSHEGIVICGNAPDGSLRGKFYQSVQWKDDVPVLLKACPIKVRRDMGHYEVAGVSVARNDSIVSCHALERTVAPTVEAGG